MTKSIDVETLAHEDIKRVLLEEGIKKIDIDNLTQAQMVFISHIFKTTSQLTKGLNDPEGPKAKLEELGKKIKKETDEELTPLQTETE